MDYPHLAPEAVLFLQRSLRDKLIYIDRELFISWDDAELAIDRIAQFLAMDSYTRRPAMVLCGDPGQGKTHLLHEAARRAGVLVAGSLGAAGANAMFIISAAGVYSLKSFYERIYSTMDMPMPKAPSVNHICAVLRKAGIRLFVIDEAHDLRSIKSNTDFGLVLNLIKEITNVLKRPLLIMGSTEVKHITRDDIHLHSRFGAPYELRAWSSAELLREFLYAFLSRLPFPRESPILDENTLLEVIRLTRGNTERIMKSTRGAARKALQAGEEFINLDRLGFELASWSSVT